MSVDVLGPEWNLSEEGLNIITENGTIKDRSQILKNALNTDLKEIGKSILTSELSKDKTSKIILQIQKIRNISAPKANDDSQAAPRMLKLILTDGDNSVQALELTSIPQISRDKTAPGTKVLINGAKIASGYLLLNPSCCSLLGGKVPYLFERWELAKSVQYNNRQSSSSDGPPPWVNFGCKIQTGGNEDNFKSLENKNVNSKDSSEFEQQRQGAIAEATSGAVKKVFGGRVKQQVVPTQNTNNFKRNNDGKGKNLKGRNLGPKEVDDMPQKPSEKVSLFDFLETKLPVNEQPEKPTERVSTRNDFAQSSNKLNYQKNKVNENVKPYPPRFNNNNRAPQNSNQNRYDNRRDNYPAFPKSNETFREPFRSNETFREPFRSNESSRDHFRSNESSKDQYRSIESSRTSHRSNESSKDQFRSNEQFKSNNHRSDNRNSSRTDVKPNYRKETNYQPSPSSIEDSVNDITSNMNRASLGNNSFASKILRQQLNINSPSPRNSQINKVNGHMEQTIDGMSVGNECLAKYWEDGKLYNAIITGITEKTYVVKFKGYGNTEEVLKKDCFPLQNQSRYGTQEYAGNTMEFHRGKRASKAN